MTTSDTAETFHLRRREGGDTACMVRRTRWRARAMGLVVLGAMGAVGCSQPAEESLPTPAILSLLPDPNAPAEPAAARPLPVTTRVVASTTSLPGSVLYTVQDGDTFFAIAEQHAITPARLSELNPLRDRSRLSVGQLLIVPGPVPAPDSPDATTTTVTASTLPAATKNG